VLVTGALSSSDEDRIRAAVPDAEMGFARRTADLADRLPAAHVIVGSISPEDLLRAGRLQWVHSWAAGVDEARFHTVALKHLGIHLGELWALEELVRRCRAADHRDFALISVPLQVRGAFGSPANAIAVL
jgi:hypothetical protein